MHHLFYFIVRWKFCEEKELLYFYRDDDDINDVATMGGVNLSEESKNILASNADFIGTQIRSCKDEAFLYHGPLLARITAIGNYIASEFQWKKGDSSIKWSLKFPILWYMISKWNAHIGKIALLTENRVNFQNNHRSFW